MGWWSADRNGLYSNAAKSIFGNANSSFSSKGKISPKANAGKLNKAAVNAILDYAKKHPEEAEGIQQFLAEIANAKYQERNRAITRMVIAYPNLESYIYDL